MTEDDLGNVFRFCGEILNVRIARNYSTKVSKGFGYVDFKENFSLKKALEMDGKIVNNRKI
jgi:RNA recognition motif-containing protein